MWRDRKEKIEKKRNHEAEEREAFSFGQRLVAQPFDLPEKLAIQRLVRAQNQIKNIADQKLRMKKMRTVRFSETVAIRHFIKNSRI